LIVFRVPFICSIAEPRDIKGWATFLHRRERDSSGAVVRPRVVSLDIPKRFVCTTM
jgi:hypothetical protein